MTCTLTHLVRVSLEKRIHRIPQVLLLSLMAVACHPKKDSKEIGDDSGSVDSGHSEDTSDSVDDTSESDDTGDTRETEDTGGTGHTGETADTVETGETADTGDTSDTSDTGETADTGDTSDTSDTGDTEDTSPLAVDFDLADAEAMYTGMWDGDFVGASVSGAGDVNSDGYDDWLFSAEGRSHYGMFVAYGPSWGEEIIGSTERASLIVSGFCSLVSDAGDVNGDGYDDVMCGTTGTFDSWGVPLLFGSASGFPESRTAGDLTDAQWFVDSSGGGLGSNGLGPAGDMDGDGYDDVLIGGTSATGEATYNMAYAFLGPFSGGEKTVAEADLSWSGAYVPVGNGDIDGDGVNDVLIGTSYRSDPGPLLYVEFSPTPGAYDLADADLTITTTARYPANAIVGDLDGDGLDDIAIGDNYDSTVDKGSGAVWLFSGSTLVDGVDSIDDADAVFHGEGFLAGAGQSLAGVGDFEGDGFSEMLVGSPGARDGGAVYILGGPFSGVHSLAHADVRIMLDDGGDVGYSVSGTGDVDADGIPDIIIGDRSWGFPARGFYYGAAFYISGSGL